MDNEKWYTFLVLKQCEEIHAFEVQNHAFTLTLYI